MTPGPSVGPLQLADGGPWPVGSMPDVTISTGGDSEFEAAVKDLEDFGVAVKRLIAELLQRAKIPVHSIDYRVKEKGSAGKKMTGAQGKYKSVRDLTDLLGIRIITYFSDEVDSVAQALMPEFSVDERNSVDKRALLEADRFGYLSLHYVAELNWQRVQLIEYEKFSGKCFEIQIRSILQHAWAEIEHDLGYKSKGALPSDIRRKFSRLAGLLEIADEEFVSIRNFLNKYEEDVSSAIGDGRIEGLEVNQSTLQSYLSEPRMLDLDREVAHALGVELETDRVEPEVAGKYARRLQRANIASIKLLDRKVFRRQKFIVALAEAAGVKRRQLDPDSDSRRYKIDRGISLFYFFMSLGLPHVASDSENATRYLPDIEHWNSGDLEFMTESWADIVKKFGDPE